MKTSYEQKIYAEQVKSLYLQAMNAVYANPFASLLVVLIFKNKVEQETLYTWFTAVLVLSILRILPYKAFFQRDHDDSSMVFFGNLFIFLSFLQGLLWGIAWLLFIPTEDPVHLAIVGMWIVGLSSSAVVAYSGMFKALLAYFIPVVIPGALHFLYIGGEYGDFLGFALLFYTVVILRAVAPINKSIIQSIELNFKFEDELSKNKFLLATNKSFIYDTVHQIKTPLSIVMNNTNIIEYISDGIKTKLYIDEIYSAVNFLSNSYEDLAYIISNDDINYDPAEQKLNEVLEDRVNFFKTIAKTRDRELVLDENKPCVVFMNKIELERLIDNNLSNAIKYATKDKTITVSSTRNVLKIKSYGEEITDKTKVFERFYRENNEKRGFGLGLNIVQRICDKYEIKLHLLYENEQNVFCYTFSEKTVQ